MKSIVICNNLLKKQSPAACIEQDLLDGLSCNGIDITAYCSSLGDLYSPSTHYKTIIGKEYKIWKYIFGGLRLVLPDLAYLPDYQYISWGLGIKNKIEQNINKENIDFIHSFSFEQSCHWLAYKLNKRYKIPWIATFFDSWSDYPTRKFKTSYFKKIDLKMERLVAEHADLIVHNNEGIARLWAARYGEKVAKKIVVIPMNVDFSKETYIERKREKSDKLIISHIGTFYPKRDASSFIEAVNLAISNNLELRSKIQVNFIGRVLDYDLDKIRRYKLDDIFNLTGRISPKECQSYYNKSDIFLSTAGLPVEDITYPSKIIKYFFYRKPILGISPHGTVLESELVESRNFCFEPTSISEIADFIVNAISDYSSICNIDYTFWKKFEVSEVSKLYINNIKKMVNG